MSAVLNDDWFTAADAAEADRDDAYQRTLAALTEGQALDALDGVPFAQLFRRGVSDADVGRIVRLALHSHVELQAATDPEEIGRLAELDPVLDLLLELSIKRAAGGKAVTA